MEEAHARHDDRRGEEGRDRAQSAGCPGSCRPVRRHRGTPAASTSRSPFRRDSMTSMNRRGTHTSLTVAVTVGLLAVDLFATCGGGGGGGTGGMGSGMGNQNVYPVPWKNAKLGDPIDPAGLALYWFPASQNELEKSSLRNSRLLALSAAQCVSLGVADVRSPPRLKFAAGAETPL